MLPDRLRSLEVAPFRLDLITTREFSVPLYKGAVFRGGFGALFREISCITRAPTCAGCIHVDTCGYSQVFETPVAPGQFQVLTKYTNAPHPFVLCPPLDGRTRLPEGTRMSVDVTLFGGAARKWFPHFLFVFDELGRRGRYGGPYRVENARSGVDGRVLFDGRLRRIVADPAPLEWDSNGQGARRVSIEFVTPLRMRTDGEYNENPDFVAFAHALLGRLHLLSAIYGGGSSDREWMRELMGLADRVRTVSREWRVLRQDRTSGRQGRRVPMDGVVGRMVVEGEMGPFLGVLRMGERVHVGSGTGMGLGRFAVRVEG